MDPGPTSGRASYPASGRSGGKVRAFVIDDSAVMRQLLSAILAEEDDIEVVGTAPDPFIAREKIKRLRPDVLTLDVEMPGMNGLKFLENLMRLHPMPVVMVSSLTSQGASATIRALELGAVDVVAKPQGDPRAMLSTVAPELRAKVRAAAQVHLSRTPRLPPPPTRIAPRPCAAVRCDRGVIAIGASTGGTQAISEILQRLPPRMPPIVVVQHMPPRFTGYFAERLNSHCALQVREANDGDRLEAGVALVAPGGRQMDITQASAGYGVRVYDGEPVNLHRPSVDVLFSATAMAAGANGLGVILTGMGSDGARGLADMRRHGALTIAQDEATSLVFGMPERAIREGGVCEVLPLHRIAERLVVWAGTESGDGEAAYLGR